MLERYLEGLQAERTGQEFSLDLQAQARKYGDFLSDEPALWLLKAVRAGVVSGAPVVHLRLTREEMEASFTPSLSPENWMLALQTALLAALAAPSRGVSLFWGKESLHGSDCPGEDGEVRLLLRRPSRNWLLFSDPLLARIHRSLHRYCSLAATPIQVDGRVINNGWIEEVGHWPALTTNPTFGESALRYRWLAQGSWLSKEKGRFPLTCPLLRRSFRLQVGSRWLETRTCYGDPYQSYESSVIHTLHTDLPVEIRSWPGTPKTSAWISLQLPAAKGLDWSSVLGLTFWKDENDQVSCAYLDCDEVAMTESWRQADGTTLKWPSMGCRRWLGIAAHAKEPGGIHYLKDGVLLAPVAGGGAFEGTTAIVADAEVQTDLSGLQVVVDDQVRRDQAWLREQEALLVSECQGAVFNTQEGEKARLPLSVRQLWRYRLKGR